MTGFFEKITRYNLFNYLLPGMIFVIFISQTTNLKLIEISSTNIVVLLFLAYFLGTIISRLGSLFIEPALKKIKFVKFVEYGKYLKVLKDDNKLDDLSQENNTYRTYISLFLTVLIINLVLYLLNYFSIDIENKEIFISIFLLLLFLFSYKKQTKYIKNRDINKLNK